MTDIVKKITKKGSLRKFLHITYSILESNKYNELIRWNDDGTQLVLVDKSEFANQVLPLYFKHSNYSSFLRQLNSYQFKNRRNENGQIQFHHPDFTRTTFNESSFKIKKHKAYTQCDCNNYLLEHEQLKNQIKVIQADQEKLQQQLMQQLQIINELRKRSTTMLRKLLQVKTMGKRRMLSTIKFIRNMLHSLTPNWKSSQYLQSIVAVLSAVAQESGAQTINFENWDNLSESGFDIDQSVELFTQFANSRFAYKNC